MRVFTQHPFTFCDDDWRLTKYIHFNQHDKIYIWQCGFSDNQKLINSYGQYGESFTQHLKGDTSFVLYDTEKEIIIAVRDFMGSFPLYYYQKAHSFIFSFSINALITSDLFDLEINYSKVADYVECDRYAPLDNQTFYQQVYRVLPGYHLIAKQGKIMDLQRYKKFDLQQYQNFSDEQFIEKFRDLFIASVEKIITPFQKNSRFTERRT